jgi:hypothetical protein
VSTRLSALRAGRPLPPWRFLVQICVRGLSRPQGHSAAEALGESKSHLIGTQTRDLPACNIVPQPTTLPRDLSRSEWEAISLQSWSASDIRNALYRITYKSLKYVITFELSAVVNFQIFVFWVTISCSLANEYQICEDTSILVTDAAYSSETSVFP